jgi:hypothetical protein
MTNVFWNIKTFVIVIALKKAQKTAFLGPTHVFIIFCIWILSADRLCGLVVRVSG